MSRKSTRTPFMADQVYHIYNRGNNREKLFYTPENYQMFLELYKDLPGTFAETYAYCLIPNHFHFLIRIKQDADQYEFVSQMRRWLIKYAMHINRQEGRMGHLFTRPIKRIHVTDEFYLKNLIRYIHLNPSKHGILLNPEDYKYSSFRSFLARDNDTIIEKEISMEFFHNDYLEFVDFHRIKHSIEEIQSFIIDDEG